MKTVIPVCYITDENYYLPTIVSMSSLLETKSSNTVYEVYLIANFEMGERSSMLDELRRKYPECTIKVLQPREIGDARVAEYKNHVTKVALLKYNLCHILPDLEKAVYIDGDTVVQKDLSELFQTDLGDNYIGAATALIGYLQKYHEWQYEARVGVPFAEYVNTGVMLMNLAAIRRDDLPEKLLAFTETHPNLVFMDQDAFNAVCKGRVTFLERRYNLMPDCAKMPSPSMQKAASRPQDAVILHFAGNKKPWVSLRAKWSRIYAGYYRRSPARTHFYRALSQYGAHKIKQKVRSPFDRVQNYVYSELRAASQRYRSFDKDERRKDEDAFAAQYFYLDQMLRGEAHGLNRGERRERQVTVSLTTIPSRIYEIGTTIESILLQTFKPDRIVLWLDRDALSEDDLPISLKGQMQRGLTVRFCEDIGPHTKLIPALKEFPQDVVITVDDDILYPNYVVERLYRNYLRDKTKIYCNRARYVSVLNRNGFVYDHDWTNVKEEVEGLNVFPLGVGGVLYPAGILGSEVFDLELQKRLAPRADDIWFKAISLKRGVVCKRIAGMKHIYPIRPHSQEVSLHITNVKGGGNEAQIAACFDHFDLWRILGAENLK